MFLYIKLLVVSINFALATESQWSVSIEFSDYIEPFWYWLFDYNLSVIFKFVMSILFESDVNFTVLNFNFGNFGLNVYSVVGFCLDSSSCKYDFNSMYLFLCNLSNVSMLM